MLLRQVMGDWSSRQIASVEELMAGEDCGMDIYEQKVNQDEIECKGGEAHDSRAAEEVLGYSKVKAGLTYLYEMN